MKLEYKGKTKQKLGVVDNEHFYISPGKDENIKDEIWEKLKETPWVKKLIGNELLIEKQGKTKTKKEEIEINVDA